MSVLVLLSFTIFSENLSFDIVKFTLFFSLFVALADDIYVYLFGWYSLDVNVKNALIVVSDRTSTYKGSYVLKKNTTYNNFNPFYFSIILMSNEDCNRNIKVNRFYLNSFDTRILNELSDKI